MLTKLDHVTIAVLDVALAVRSYQALLGCPPRWRGSHPELGTSAALFALSNSMVELMGPSPEAPDAVETQALRDALQAHGEGLSTLSFGTDRAVECTRLLRELGLRATTPQDGEARSHAGVLRSYRLVELSPRSTRSLPISIVERSEPLVPDSAAASERGEVQALDHVVIASADLDQAVTLYRDKLGLRLALDRVVRGVRMLFFRVGGVTLEFVHDPARAEADALTGLAYRVQDLSAAHERMRGAGIELSERRAGLKPGTEVFTVRSGTHGVPTLVLRDPSRDVRPS